MREPEPIGDPYRTLGLEPGASMAEVKRAYRRLAKAFHPDSAGEAALPRFLAIHEAYDRLQSGRAFAGAGPTRTAPSEPWRADPERAQAARERARAGRRARASASGAPWGSGGAAGAAGTPGGGGGSTSASSRPGASGTAGARSSASAPGSAGAPGSASRTTSGTSGTAGGGPAGSPPGSRGSTGTAAGGAAGRRRATRKATLGSTSYDEARDPADATWAGASWYGPSTGEYWIINPREYADPRKHGPDYQSRARRPSMNSDDEWAPPEADAQTTMPEDGAPPTEADPDWTDPIDAPSAGPAPEPAGAGAGASAGQPDERRWAGGSARTAAGPAMAGSLDGAPAGPTPWRRDGAGMRRRVRRQPLGGTTRDWLGGSTDDPIRRLGIALVAWPPIGLAAAAAIGEATGCASYAAACAGTDSLLPWLAQAGILGVLLLFPPLARLLAGGTIAIVLAILPVTGFLLAVGASGAPQAGTALAVLLGGAWLVGVAWSLMASRRRAIESGRLGARDGP